MRRCRGTPWSRQCARCWWGSARTSAGRGCAGRPSASPRPSATAPEVLLAPNPTSSSSSSAPSPQPVDPFVIGLSRALALVLSKPWQCHLFLICDVIRRLRRPHAIYRPEIRPALTLDRSNAVRNLSVIGSKNEGLGLFRKCSPNIPFREA